MEFEENKTEWIDAYLDDTLETQERLDFENLLEQDTVLRQEVDAQKAVRKSLQDWGNIELKDKFKQFHARMKQQEDPNILATDEELNEGKGKTRPLWSRLGAWSIAASIALLVMAGVLWLNHGTSFNNPTSETLASHTLQIPVTLKGSDNLGYAVGGAISDSVMVQIMPDAAYPLHYRFRDTLQIFSPTISSDDTIMLEHQVLTDTYILVINEKRYPVERGFNRIQELKEE